MELPTNGIRQFVLKESLRLTHTQGLTVQSLRFQFGCSRTILMLLAGGQHGQRREIPGKRPMVRTLLTSGKILTEFVSLGQILVHLAHINRPASSLTSSLTDHR